MDDKKGPQDIDEYIASFPEDIQARLETVRETIRAAAPEAVEAISYQMPTFRLHGNLVHFAAYKHHLGFYPSSSGIARFQADLSPYKWAKGSVQFPHDRPLPLALIEKITAFRVEENLAKAAAKRRK